MARPPTIEDYVPLDIAAVKSRLRERFAAITAANGVAPKGRKAAFEALLATKGHGATVVDMQKLLGKAVTPTKMAILRLIDEGLVQKRGIVPGGFDLFAVTESGAKLGYKYEPPAISSPVTSAIRERGWGKSGRTRLATLKTLLACDPDDPGLTIREILVRARLKPTVEKPVSVTVKVGMAQRYIQATMPGRQLGTKYALTKIGRQRAQEYVAAYDHQEVTFTVTYTGEPGSDAHNSLLQLLAGLLELDDVYVDGLPQQPEDD